MEPVDSFMHSVRAAFQPSDAGMGWTWVGLAACAVLVVTWTLFRRLRRREAQRKSFTKFLTEHRVSSAQAALIDKLASRAAVDPQVLATRVDVFERATALELTKHPATATGGDEGVFGQIAALRTALGFAHLGDHFALLTTRQLGNGQLVAVAGTEATVSEVNEAHFSVAAPVTATFPTGPAGSRVRVTLIHGQEARYEARCPLLARQPGEAAQRLILGHDEQPTRIQLRKSVRVIVRGPVRLNPVGGALMPESDDAGSAETEKPNLGNASLLDISVGGAALDSTVSVPVGSLVQLSFELDGTAYRELLAHVLECALRGRETHHMRLEFRGLAQADEQQLAASVARYSAKPFTQHEEPTK